METSPHPTVMLTNAPTNKKTRLLRLNLRNIGSAFGRKTFSETAQMYQMRRSTAIDVDGKT
jgi:hypothetical protein